MSIGREISMQVTRFVITLFISVIPTLTISSCQLISNPQALAQSLSTQEAKANELLEVTGLDDIEIEILRGSSFGEESIRRIFQGGEWEFYPNGKFTFTQFFQDDSPISGTYEKVGNNFEFQGEQVSDVNSTISIDGTIHINEEEIFLEAIFISSDSPQQIARISQSLTKGKAVQKSEQSLSSEKSLENEKAEINDDLIAELEALEAELEALGINPDLTEKEIDGIKIPSQFRISLEGKTDKGVFGSLSGTLYINESALGSQSPVSVSLAINPDLYGTNGWISLNSEEAGRETPNIQIQTNNGQVLLELSPSEVMRSSTYTLGADETSSDLNRPVLIENGILTFAVEGNQISGEIKASGIVFPDAGKHLSDAEQTTYEAKLTGEIPTSTPVEKLKAALVSSFNGQWDTDNSSFGRIELQQNGQQVSGTYTGNGTGIIEGIARGNRLDFTWQDSQRGEKGRGFFRAVAGGGKLVGIWWPENRASQTKGESLIASWQLPSFINTENFSSFDLQELRYLGQELALQNRCEPAVILLDQVIASYIPEQQEKTQGFEIASVEKDQDLEGNLTSALFSLNFLVNCHFQLGNYNQLLKSLDYGLEILPILGPDESASRLFRQRTAEINEALISNVDQSEFIENVYKIWQQIASGTQGVIGISVEQNGTTKEVVVDDVEGGLPANLAGIKPQDVIVKIDGKTSQGMNEQQVLESLRGKPGTPVTITVRRVNQELEFQLIRTKVEIGSRQRQVEFVEVLKLFAGSRNLLQEGSKNSLNSLSTLAERIAQGQEEPISALLSIPRNLESQIIQLNEETNVLIDRGREFFSQQEESLEEIEFIFSQFRNISREAEIDFQDLDSREERLMQLIENNQDLSTLEKQFFRGYYADIIERQSFLFTLKSQKNLLEKIDAKKAFEENKKRSLEMTSGFTDRLETWRTRLVKDLDKIAALDQGQPFFQKAIKFAIELDEEEEALVTSEKSRARAFADLLSARLTSSAAFSPSAEKPTIQGIKKIAKQQNSTLVEYSIIEDDLYIWVVKPTGEVKFKLVDLKLLSEQQETSKSEPAFSFSPTAAITYPWIIAIFVFVIGGFIVFIFWRKRLFIAVSITAVTCIGGLIFLISQNKTNLIGRDSGSRNVEKNRTAPTKLVPSTRESISTSSRILSDIIKGENGQNTEESLRQLHQLLIQPIADLLPANPDAQVIFIPQGDLFFVPFSALKTPTGQYLIEKHTIRITPSIQALELTYKQREQISGWTEEALVVGNPYPMPKISLESGEELYPVLDPLSGAEKEAQEIAQLLGSQPIINKQATESAIVKQMPSARIIHLATHGLLGDFDNSGLPGAVALAPYGKDDGLLGADEIFALELNAELVVLSACDTALGRITGDGVIGLSRSFFRAGVPSVVVSLWKVPDDPTAELMTEFYKNLEGNSNKAQALRQAMLTTMKQYPDPWAWAAFTLIGES